MHELQLPHIGSQEGRHPVNRKMLADLAVNDSAAFGAIVAKAKEALGR